MLRPCERVGATPEGTPAGETTGLRPRRIGALVALALLLAAPAAAQDGEFDRQIEPEEEARAGRDLPPPAEGAPRPEPPPISPSALPVPDQDVPAGQRDERFIPEEGLDPNQLPVRQPRALERVEPEPSLWHEVELSFEGRVRTGLGHDRNVFRADRGPRSDGFFRGSVELELLAQLPQGSEVFVEVSTDSQLYFEQHKADEHFGAAFAEYFHPVTGWLDLGIQNTFEISKQNLLDDNGDLFPRGRFGSTDEEVRPYLILRPHVDVAIETGVGFRYKDYEENDGVDSLDYRELRADAAVSYKLARQPRSRIKLKYRFRRRDYRAFRARERDGTTDPFAPHLDLFRHQLSLTWYQELTLGLVELRVILSLGLSYNQDRHENDRSYREGSTSMRIECWFVPEMTRLDLSLRAVGRDFLVRQPTGSGGALRHRLLDASAGIWQRLSRDLPVAVYGTASGTVWRSGDAGEDYERFVLEAGLEVFF